MTLTAKSQGFNASNLNKSDFFYHIITTMESLFPQARHDLTLKAIVEGWFMRRKRSFSRSYLAKATGLHKDTISTHNVFWQSMGILQIERAYHEVNRYGHKFIGVLGEVFGFVKPMESRSASLLTNLNLNNKNNLLTYEESTPKKGEIGEKSPDRKNQSKNFDKFVDRDLTVFCPYDSGMGINTYLLFDEDLSYPITIGVDVAAAPSRPEVARLPRGKEAVSFLQALKDKINSLKHSKQ